MSVILASLHVVLSAASDVASSTIGNLSAEGLLAAALAFLAREYKSEKNQREALNEKMLTEVVPLLSRSAEAVERISFLYREALDSPRPRNRSRPKPE